MASVHLAVAAGDSQHRQKVALKRLHAHMKANPVAMQLFAQEARLAGLITHPNCLAAHDIWELDGTLHLVMAYAPGICLRRLLRYCVRRGTRVPLGLCARVMLDALEGLHAVHWAFDGASGCLGIVHQDLSLPNLLLGNDGVCRIVDFGAANVRAWQPNYPAGVIVGTLGYAAPERFDLEEAADQRSDIYAMGVVLWELLAGRRLFNDALNTQALVEKVRRSDVKRPSVFSPVPEAVEDVCMRALAYAPRDRFGSAIEFRLALADAVLAHDIDVWEALHVGAVVRVVGTSLGGSQSNAGKSSPQTAQPSVPFGHERSAVRYSAPTLRRAEISAAL
jgi:eukaryotic-like serine/threonine-protein kinase